MHCYNLASAGFSFNNRTCGVFAGYTNGLLTQDWMFEEGLILEPFLCYQATPNFVQICATYASAEVAQEAADYIAANDFALVELMWDYMRLRRYLCGGQGSLQFSSESDCISPLLYNSRACALDQTPFPFCECDKTPGSMPFGIDYYYSEPANSKFCFTVLAVPANDPTSSCGKITTVKKVEFYIQDAVRRQIKSVVDKSGKTLRTSWGASGDNTFKVTPLSWTLPQLTAAPQLICIITTGAELSDLCVGGGCTASVFDDAQKCCPTSTSQLEPVVPDDAFKPFA
ncbi:hypothetical protein HXX76_000480 [Chlamydomonas incerta]|uniref:Pherophorin domain-containing protein n=1 Tax=Chlamydomonas incerta TaxID=51695 RepID=A0A835WEP9_CHLIN|nr:hypothetical protein HXX76_000480 [Chlamydomonas incerta]|eukprot:KAG2445876.1 hypothetical protein HXX76_000480 [Chlamydomonas incerta]